MNPACASVLTCCSSPDCNTWSRARTLFLPVFAYYERDILRDRAKAGIAEARKNGKPHGRPATEKPLADEVNRLFISGISKSQIAKRLGIGRTSVIQIIQTKRV